MPLNNKVISCTRIVHYSDCDPMAHLNNARYIDYFLNSREEQLQKQLNFSLRDYAQMEGKGWFVLRNQIAYLSPAVYNEEITMESKVVRFNKRDSLVEMLMYDSSRSKIKSILWTSFRHVNIKNGRSEDHPPHIEGLLKENLVEISTDNFDDRITELTKHS